jgi:hypothetical protein
MTRYFDTFPTLTIVELAHCDWQAEFRRRNLGPPNAHHSVFRRPYGTICQKAVR